MTEQELRDELMRFIKREHGTSTRAASEWGVSLSYVSKVTTGLKPIPEWMLNKIGYARKIVRIK